MAATGVSIGFILNRLGNTNPIPPNNSLTPINLTNATGTLAVHGTDFDKSIMGWIAFIIPAIMNIPPRIICATHKAMCSAFGLSDCCFIIFSFFENTKLLTFTYKK